MPPSNVQPGRTLLFLGAISLAAIAFVLFAPLVECPICRLIFDIEQGVDGRTGSKVYLLRKGCDHCWRGRISAYTRWLNPRYPFHGTPFEN
jgi:hypothetical protein